MGKNHELIKLYWNFTYRPEEKNIFKKYLKIN